MVQVTLDDFSDKEVARIYLAGELAEAKRVEEILSANGINYAVEVEPYVRLSVFSFFFQIRRGGILCTFRTSRLLQACLV